MFWPKDLITDSDAVGIDPTMGCDRCAHCRRAECCRADRRRGSVSVSGAVATVVAATVIAITTAIAVSAVPTPGPTAMVDSTMGPHTGIQRAIGLSSASRRITSL